MVDGQTVAYPPKARLLLLLLLHLLHPLLRGKHSRRARRNKAAASSSLSLSAARGDGSSKGGGGRTMWDFLNWVRPHRSGGGDGGQKKQKAQAPTPSLVLIKYFPKLGPFTNTWDDLVNDSGEPLSFWDFKLQ
jgi:hypothetical protein